MNAADLSVFVFGVYAIAVVGCGFVFMPNVVLPMFRLPKTNEVWIRMVGFVVALIGFYYISAALAGLTVFYWATVWGRFALLPFLVVLVTLRKIKATAIVFGVVDAAGAVWTLVALT